MSSNTSGNATGSPVIEVFEQMQKDGNEFFLNSQLRPTVKIPSDGFQKEWPIDSQRVQDLVISLYYEKTNERITTADREYLMALIREECRHGKRSHTEDEAEETDKDVIVQAVMCHMNKHKMFKDRTIVLLKHLQKIQRSNQTSFEEFIPVFTNIFSRRLRRLIPVLRGYGIAVTLEHRDDGSYCSLQRLDSFDKEPNADDVQPESSGASSGGTTNEGENLPPADDSDGESRIDPSTSRAKAAVSTEPAVTDSSTEAQAATALKGGAK